MTDIFGPVKTLVRAFLGRSGAFLVQITNPEFFQTLNAYWLFFEQLHSNNYRSNIT
jgi:hypothetical protein